MDSLLLTEDGSHTLQHAALKENYHSIHGAINESVHIFIQAGLQSCSHGHHPLQVLEIGFGTGLNAFLTLHYAQTEKAYIQYLGFEPFPISVSTAQKLNYPDLISSCYRNDFLLLHQEPWNQKIEFPPYFSFQKIQGQIQMASLDDDIFDVAYFDSFSPEVQPEMWTEAIFMKIFRALKPQGILVTYCAKGMVKRALSACGFSIEPLPGPKGKREITRARKP